MSEPYEPYLDASKYPLTTQPGLDLDAQVFLDGYKLDGLADAVAEGNVLNEHQLRVLAELNVKRALWRSMRDRLRAAGRPTA